MVQFGGTWRLRERFVYLEEWLETRARPSHPPIGRFLLVKYKPRAGAWCNELNQREGLILAFIVCVSSVNGGMAPGEMEIIFATEYGFRMCSPFRLGSRDERRPSQKFLFPTQRRRPVTSVRDECDERNSFENSDLRTTLQCPCYQFGCSKLWVVVALRRQEESEEKIYYLTRARC